MPILTTCSAHRDYDRVLSPDAYRGVLPSYTELTLSDDPALAFIDAVRHGLHLHKQQPGNFVASQRYPSARAWSARHDGATCILRFDTLDPGFSVEWTLEIVSPDRIFTASVDADSMVEVFEYNRIDQPVATAAVDFDRSHIVDRNLRSLGFERVSQWRDRSALALAVER